MKYAIITENDESQWDDYTGISYNYPSKYLTILVPGTKVIYYKGRLNNPKYIGTRLSNDPHYFGTATIGESYLDEAASRKEYHCDIHSYQRFSNAVPFKIENEYLEDIPDSKKSNYWRDGVREISKKTFDKILKLTSIQLEPRMHGNITVSTIKFDEIYKHFPQFIHDISEGKQYLGFSDGYVYESESYKDALRLKSLNILKTTDWAPQMVGSGQILDKTIETFELEDNNLIGTRRKFGPDSVPHKKMLIAQRTGEHVKEMEETLFDLYKTNTDHSSIFSRMVKLIGKQYSVLAFLFYLKNDRQYLPISTSHFESAFKSLGCELKLKQKCSWKNYSEYLSLINQIKNALEANMNQNINLIDAHSFCWLVGYKNRYQEWLKNNLSEERITYTARVIDPINKNNQRRLRSSILNRDGSFDWDKENKRKRLKGKRAEEQVIEYEKQRLKEAGKKELAVKVKDYSAKYSKGFDVLSWNTDGSERHIEVKSSNSNNFIISRNELNKSAEDPNYWIYVVSEYGNHVQIKQLKSPLLKDGTKFKLEPKSYYVSFSEAK